MNNLRELRKDRHMVQQELAKKARTTPGMLVSIEKYDYEPSLPIRERLAAVLGVPLTAIWPPDPPEES